MDDKQNISLWVGNQLFELIVPREDEKLYRDAAKLIKDKLNRYRREYPSFTTDRIWAMSMLELSFQYVMVKDRNDTQPFIDKIKELTTDIDQCIGTGK